MKIQSLCENRDFKRIYARGRSFVTPLCVVYTTKNKLGIIRLGITTSKKIGCAVKRNRARRLMAEAFRLIVAGNTLVSGVDIVLVARGKTPYSKLGPVKAALTKAFQSIGLIQSV